MSDNSSILPALKLAHWHIVFALLSLFFVLLSLFFCLKSKSPGQLTALPLPAFLQKLHNSTVQQRPETVDCWPETFHASTIGILSYWHILTVFVLLSDIHRYGCLLSCILRTDLAPSPWGEGWGEVGFWILTGLGLGTDKFNDSTIQRFEFRVTGSSL